jgi:hypothetical protein
VDGLHDELKAFEQKTITLRLDEREAFALLEILVLIPPRHERKPEAVRIVDRLAYEMDNFKWRRLASE